MVVWYVNTFEERVCSDFCLLMSIRYLEIYCIAGREERGVCRGCTEI